MTDFDEEKHHAGAESTLMGAIFMCNQSTMKVCFKRKLFGLPPQHEKFVAKIKVGMILFLFEYEARKLYGVFEAASNGGTNIVPGAFRATGKTFSAQVRFKSLWYCRPLAENEFRRAIKDNYYTHQKFNFGLSREQVSGLLRLFNSRKKSGPELRVKPAANVSKPGLSRSELRGSPRFIDYQNKHYTYDLSDVEDDIKHRRSADISHCNLNHLSNFGEVHLSQDDSFVATRGESYPTSSRCGQDNEEYSFSRKSHFATSQDPSNQYKILDPQKDHTSGVRDIEKDMSHKTNQVGTFSCDTGADLPSPSYLYYTDIHPRSSSFSDYLPSSVSKRQEAYAGADFPLPNVTRSRSSLMNYGKYMVRSDDACYDRYYQDRSSHGLATPPRSVSYEKMGKCLNLEAEIPVHIDGHSPTHPLNQPQTQNFVGDYRKSSVRSDAAGFDRCYHGQPSHELNLPPRSVSCERMGKCLSLQGGSLVGIDGCSSLHPLNQPGVQHFVGNSKEERYLSSEYTSTSQMPQVGENMAYVSRQIGSLPHEYSCSQLQTLQFDDCITEPQYRSTGYISSSSSSYKVQHLGENTSFVCQQAGSPPHIDWSTQQHPLHHVHASHLSDKLSEPRHQSTVYTSSPQVQKSVGSMLLSDPTESPLDEQHCYQLGHGDAYDRETYHSTPERVHCPSHNCYNVKSKGRSSVFSRLSMTTDAEREAGELGIDEISLDQVMSHLDKQKNNWTKLKSSKRQAAFCGKEADKNVQFKTLKHRAAFGGKETVKNLQFESSHPSTSEGDMLGSCEENGWCGNQPVAPVIKDSGFINFKRRSDTCRSNEKEKEGAFTSEGGECSSQKPKRRKLIRPSFSVNPNEKINMESQHEQSRDPLLLKNDYDDVAAKGNADKASIIAKQNAECNNSSCNLDTEELCLQSTKTSSVKCNNEAGDATVDRACMLSSEKSEPKPQTIRRSCEQFLEDLRDLVGNACSDRDFKFAKRSPVSASERKFCSPSSTVNNGHKILGSKDSMENSRRPICVSESLVLDSERPTRGSIGTVSSEKGKIECQPLQVSSEGQDANNVGCKLEDTGIARSTSDTDEVRLASDAVPDSRIEPENDGRLKLRSQGNVLKGSERPSEGSTTSSEKCNHEAFKISKGRSSILPSENAAIQTIKNSLKCLSECQDLFKAENMDNSSGSNGTLSDGLSELNTREHLHDHPKSVRNHLDDNGAGPRRFIKRRMRQVNPQDHIANAEDARNTHSKNQADPTSADLLSTKGGNCESDFSRNQICRKKMPIKAQFKASLLVNKETGGCLRDAVNVAKMSNSDGGAVIENKGKKQVSFDHRHVPHPEEQQSCNDASFKASDTLVGCNSVDNNSKERRVIFKANTKIDLNVRVEECNDLETAVSERPSNPSHCKIEETVIPQFTCFKDIVSGNHEFCGNKCNGATVKEIPWGSPGGSS